MNIHVFVRHSSRDLQVDASPGTTLREVLQSVGYPPGNDAWHFWSNGKRLPLSTPVVSGMDLVLTHAMSEKLVDVLG